MRKIEVEEANVTVFGVYIGTLHASDSLHRTDMSRKIATDFRCTDSADRITRCLAHFGTARQCHYLFQKH